MSNRSSHRSSVQFILGAAVLASLPVATANAATKYWDTSVDPNLQPAAGIWDTNTTANWSDATGGSNPLVAWQDGDDASFSNISGSTAYTVTVNGTVTANSITSAGNVTLDGGTIRIGGGITNTGGASNSPTIKSAIQLAATQNFTNTWNTGNIVVDGVISETASGQGINVVNLNAGGVSPTNGSGYLELTKANTFTGGVTIGSGTNTTNVSGLVQVRNNASLGTGTVTLNGGRLGTPASGGSAVNLANNLVVNTGTNNVLISGTGADLTLSGDITGGGVVRRFGSSLLRLSGDNSGFTGTLSHQSNELYFDNAASGSASATWELQQPARLNHGTGTLHLGAITGTNIWSRAITTSTTGTYTLVVGEANVPSASFSGELAQFNGNSSLNVIKRGSGIQSIGASGGETSNYGGTTKIEAGEWRVNGTHNGAGDYTVDAGGKLGGAGIIGLGIAARKIDVNGTLSPGNGNIGTLTVNTGSINVAGTVEMEIDLTNNTFDRLVGTHTMNYGGTLKVSFSGINEEGDSFDLFDFASYTGNFNSFQMDGLQPGQTYDFAPDTGVLTISAVPEPSAMAVLAIGAAMIVRRRRAGR